MRLWHILSLLMLSLAGPLLAADPQPVADVFPPNKMVAKLEPAGQKGVAQVMEERFGTPRMSKMAPELPIDYGRAIDVARPAGWKFRAGQASYLEHCAACHGIGGDGAGPKAAGLDPPPRDFRGGEFKWQSGTERLDRRPSRPLRHDLTETIRVGVPGTAMSPFAKLSPETRSDLAEYVRWLAIRGEFEKRIAGRFIDVTEAEEVRTVTAEGFEEELAAVTALWKAAEEKDSVLRPKAKRPEPTAASLARGKAVWSDAKVRCSYCHAPDGRGVPIAAAPGRPTLTAWDLNAAPLRGGATPEDVFRRIRGGIPAGVMPAFPEKVLSDEDVWHLVNYTLSLAPEKVRSQQVLRAPPP